MTPRIGEVYIRTIIREKLDPVFDGLVGHRIRVDQVNHDINATCTILNDGASYRAGESIDIPLRFFDGRFLKKE